MARQIALWSIHIRLASRSGKRKMNDTTDPDQDILDKLDRRETGQRVIVPALAAFAVGSIVGLISYETMRRVFLWPDSAPLYGGSVVAIGASVWLFVRLTEDR